MADVITILYSHYLSAEGGCTCLAAVGWICLTASTMLHCARV